MKKTTLTFLFFSFINYLFSQNVLENQFKYHKLNTIYFAPTNLGFKNIQFGYERFINLKNSLAIKSNYGSDTDRFNSINDPNSFVINAELSYRRYILYNIIKKEKVADKEKAKSLWIVYCPFHGISIRSKF